MKITPLDIQHFEFSRSVFGYAPKEVRHFLDSVKDELKNLIAKNNEQEEEIKLLETLLAESRKKETFFQEAIMSMQKVSHEIEQNSQRDAAMILEQAEQKAEHILKQSHEKLMVMIAEINDMKKQKAQFKADLRTLVETHLRLLELQKDSDRYMAPPRDHQTTL